MCTCSTFTAVEWGIFNSEQLAVCVCVCIYSLIQVNCPVFFTSSCVIGEYLKLTTGYEVKVSQFCHIYLAVTAAKYNGHSHCYLM